MATKTKADMRNSGLTLIEILAVVAIVSLLAAMLLPVLAQVRDTAHMVSCKNGMKQVHLAISLYTQDFGRYLPVSRDYLPGDTCWYQNLTFRGYTSTKKWGPLLCPAAGVKDSLVPTSASGIQ